MIGRWRVAEDGYKSPNVRGPALPQPAAQRPAGLLPAGLLPRLPAAAPACPAHLAWPCGNTLPSPLAAPLDSLLPCSILPLGSGPGDSRTSPSLAPSPARLPSPGFAHICFRPSDPAAPPQLRPHLDPLPPARPPPPPPGAHPGEAASGHVPRRAARQEVAGSGELAGGQGAGDPSWPGGRKLRASALPAAHRHPPSFCTCACVSGAALPSLSASIMAHTPRPPCRWMPPSRPPPL